LVFIHGGAWTRNSREDISYPASILIDRGAAYLAPDFGSLRTARLPALVENCRLAVAWAVSNARALAVIPVGFSSPAIRQARISPHVF
jgi:arylformamidase